MRLHFTLLYFIICFGSTKLVTQNVLWVNSLGSFGPEGTQSICKDTNDNYYVLTQVDGSPVFSNFSTPVSITNLSREGIFIAKYNKNGILIWVKCYSSGGTFQPLKIICDANQNIIASGKIYGNVTIGFSTYTPSSSDGETIIIKINPNGNLLISTRILYQNNRFSLAALCSDNLRNIYITNGRQLISLNENFAQQYSINLPSNYNIGDITYSNGSIFTIGSALGSFSWLSASSLASINSYDLIVSSLDKNGSLNWIRRYGDTLTNEFGAFIRVKNEKVVIAMNYDKSTNIAGQNIIYRGNTNQNLAILIGDTTGNFNYSNTITSDGTSVAQLLDINFTNNSVFLSGAIPPNIRFGSDIATKGTNSTTDFFLAKMDTFANFLWVVDGGQNGAVAWGLCIDTSSNVIFTGRFENTLKLIDKQRVSRGGVDMFIAKILDISLRKDRISTTLPQCAGDSLSVLYTKRGTYNIGNTFYAQLSNPQGNYENNTVIIGSRLDTASGFIRCKLPDTLPTSKLYQIRLYSDSPAVNSFPDTTSYLIYAQPKADAGTDTLLCRGQAAFIPNTSKADTFSWSPANLLIDARKKEVQSLPLNNRTSFVLKATIGVCSKYDTVTVTYRSRLRIVGSKDSTICDDDTITLQSFRAGGDSLGYSVQWYELGQNANWQLRAVDTNSYTVFNLPPGAPSQFAAVLTDGCTVIPDTAIVTVTTRDPLIFNLPTTQAICEGLSTSLQVQATGGIDAEYKFIWRNATGTVLADTTILEINPATIADTLFIIQLTDGCSAPIADTISLTVSNKPNASYSVDTTQGCQPLTVQFLYTGSQSAVNLYNWEFSDGQTSTIQNPQMVFPNMGVYGASLIVDNGCLDTIIQDSFITVFEQSIAAFTATPLEAELPNAVITLENNSLNSINYKWLLPNDQFDTVFQPQLILNDTGLYQLVLIAKSKDGCLDTASQQVRVIEVFKLEIPNVFTPNGDGKNDTWNFEGTGYTVNEITLFNRWGTIVYNNNKSQVSWDGKDNNGKEITAGTYFYTLRLVTIDGITKELKGTVAVMR